MTDIAPEFSRLISTARLGGTALSRHIEANEEERAALAARFGLVSIERLVADVTLARQLGGAVRLDAQLDAAITQSCIVTLEPVPEIVGDRFTLYYRSDIDEDEANRLALENPEDDIVEPLIGDVIDIAEAVAQQLAVVMDSFPKVPGAEIPLLSEIESNEFSDPSEMRPNPFEKLARLKK